jgi:signal transduction histidine kinase
MEKPEPTTPTITDETRQLEFQIREFSRNYSIGLELVSKISDPKELLDTILNEYVLRLDELKGVDLNQLENSEHLVEEKEKFRSLIMFATQAAALHEKVQLYEKLDETNQELRSVNDQLDSKNKQLAALNEHYLNMLSFASHELRSPLISILGYAELLSDQMMGEINSEQNEAIEIIIKVSKNLIDMIKNYLDLTRIETGQLALRKKRERVEIRSEIIDPVLFEMSEQFNKREMTVPSTTVDPLYMDIDRDLMRIVFINLFSNAVKYGEKGSIIRYAIDDFENHFRFSIANRGIGVKPEKIHIIFDKFTQAPESQQIDTPKGTGLGLFISQKIIEEHGGRIWAESTFGEDFTAFFTIPKHIEPLHTSRVEHTEHVNLPNNRGH